MADKLAPREGIDLGDLFGKQEDAAGDDAGQEGIMAQLFGDVDVADDDEDGFKDDSGDGDWEDRFGKGKRSRRNTFSNINGFRFIINFF